MNKLEQLSNQNIINYQRYLQRMTDSMKRSTKGLIPILARDGNNILDVGCGSGVMLSALEKENPNAKLTGIDLNIEAINKLKKYNSNWKLMHIDFMKMNNYKYDTIIFSSILHEISSYNDDLNKRFTEKPILEALYKTNELLDDNGIIIIRDGLLVPNEQRNNQLVISFNNPDDYIWLYKFQKDFRGFDKLNINKDIIKLANNKFLVTEVFLKEFLYTFTWGEESYSREINERFGILTKNEWLELLKIAGFKVETTIESREEYEKFLSKKVMIVNEFGDHYEYPNMTIVLKAHKTKKLFYK